MPTINSYKCYKSKNTPKIPNSLSDTLRG